MFTRISFINKATCNNFINKLKYYSDIFDYLSVEEVENAIEQFDIARDKGGDYFCNIINNPHFAEKQIEEILPLPFAF